MATQIFGMGAGSAVADAAKGVASSGAGALSDVVEVLKKLAAVVSTVVPGAETLTNALKSIGGALASAAGKLYDFGKSLMSGLSGLMGDKVTGALTAFGKSLGSIGAVAGIAGGAAVALGLALGSFVEKANPAVFQQFQLALDDLMAVIGRAVVPIFQTVVIPVIRMFADMLMNLAPIGAAFAQAMKPLVAVFGFVFEVVGRVLTKVGEIALKLSPALEAIGEVFLELVKAVEPIYDLLIDLVGGVLVEVAGALASAVKAVVPYISAFAQVVGDLVKQLSVWIRELLAMLGVNLPETQQAPKGSGIGAAVRSAGHSSFEDVVKQAQKSSFSLGTASKEDPLPKIASTSEAMKAEIAEIKSFIIEKLPNLILELPGRLANVLVRNVTGGKELDFNKYQKDYGVSFPSAVGEAASIFWGDVKRDVRGFGDKLSQPVKVGGVNLNPFS